MKIGEKIRHFREMKNLDQKHMAKAVGINQGHYSRIEKGLTDIKFSILEKIVEELEIKLQDLITFDAAQYFNNINTVNNIGYNIYNNALAQDIEKIKERLTKIEKRLEVRKEK